MRADLKGLLNLARGLAQRGLKVDLVVIEPAGPEPLLAEGDVDALAEAILATLDNPTDPDVLRQRASIFSLKKISDLYLEALNLKA